MNRTRLANISSAALVVVGLVFVVVGCAQRDLRPVTPCTTSGVVQSVKINQVNNVDLMFVVDASQSMSDEISELAAKLPTLVKALVSGDKTPEDGVDNFDFQPVKFLNLGVITVDMGVLGADASGLVSQTGDSQCHTNAYTLVTGSGAQVGLGDDGVLWNTPNVNIPGCEDQTDTQRFLPFDSTIYPDRAQLLTATEALTNKFNCWQRQIIKEEVGGTELFYGQLSCGFEQQLEAMLKAVYPRDNTDFTFFGGTPGHAGPTLPADTTSEPLNGGFVRNDSLLAIVMVTDEEDCSAANTGTAEEGGPFISGLPETNVLCQRAAQKLEDGAASQLNPIQRYVDGLLKVRPDPNLLVFAAITGLSQGAASFYSNPSNINYDAILADPGMSYGEMPTPTCIEEPCDIVFRPACTVASPTGTVSGAGPGRRYVQLAKALEERDATGVVQSICQEDFGPAIDAIIQRIADALGAVCLPRELNVNPETGLVDCEITETLPSPTATTDPAIITHCADLVSVGRVAEPLLVDDSGRETCLISQVPQSLATSPCDAATGVGCGWYYDNFSQDVAQNCPNSPQRISFTTGSDPQRGSEIRLECLQRQQSIPAIGAFQNLGSTCNTGAPCDSGQTCDPITSTCQIGCESSAQCPDGYVCDNERTVPVCINPTCTQ